MNKTIYSRGLDKARQDQIRALDETCSASGPLHMKLNWDMLESRPQSEINDLLYVDNEELVGYLGLYDMGQDPPEIEITGMVLPDRRRQGIFSELFSDAVDICRTRGAERLLLVIERQSESGKRFAESKGLTYAFSEYRMRCEAYTPPAELAPGFSLRPAVPADIRFLADLDTVCFGSVFPGGYNRELEHLFVAVADSNAAGGLNAVSPGMDIGKVGLIYDGGMGYIFGVAILPEFRGRGFGRAMLDAVLKKHFAGSTAAILLEVATQNDTALCLYRSVGFETLTIYDYYEKRFA